MLCVSTALLVPPAPPASSLTSTISDFPPFFLIFSHRFVVFFGGVSTYFIFHLEQGAAFVPVSESELNPFHFRSY